MPNHALPKPGDLVVIRSKQKVLGVSMLTSVEHHASWKTRLRCPNCLSTKLKWSSVQESFRCSPCSNVISTPHSEFLRGIDSYHAQYDWFFTPLEEVSIPQIRHISKTPNGQQSIQTGSLVPLLGLLPKEALWRLGYSKLGVQYLRRDQLAVGRASTGISRSDGTCAISGITSADRLVRFKFLCYSSKNNQILLEGICDVIDILAAQLELGNCIANLADNSIVIPAVNGLPTISFPIKAQREDIMQWLSVFSGQLND